MSQLNGNGNGHPNGIPDPRFERVPSPADRLPPQNLEAERGVLGSILIDQEAMLKVLGLVDVPDFYRDAHQIIFEALKDLADEGKPIDAVTLADKLIARGIFEKIGGDDTLREIVDSVPHAANAAYYAQIVREKAIKRRLAEAALATIDAVYSGRHTAGELMDEAQRQLVGVGPIEEEEEDIALPGPWPDPPAEAAFQGPLGEIVRAIDPHSTADVAATLLQLLAGWGNLIGRGPHWYFESTRHSLNLFLCIVGKSSRARKGTSWGNVRRVLREIDRDWEARQIASGFASGEALIDSVRDARHVLRKSESGQYSEEEVEPAVQDKRILWVQTEFGATLTLKGREGNILSYTMRDAWDGASLEARSRKNSVRASDAHVSAIGHITIRELQERLGSIDMVNGFANRYLWACVRKSKDLPMGGSFRTEMIRGPIEDLQDALSIANRTNWSAPMTMARDAVELWYQVYDSLSRERAGVLDDLCARAEPQVWRLAGIYATAGRSPTLIQRRHLEAALAVWQFCEGSVHCLFGNQVELNSDDAKLLQAIRASGQGMTRSQMQKTVFRNHKTARELGEILGRLITTGSIRQCTIKTAGRDKIVWMVPDSGSPNGSSG